MTAIVIFAKAPVAGLAKTRLAPALGAAGAAAVHARLVEATVRTAIDARLGPVTLACAPDGGHPFFVRLAAAHPLRLVDQGEGDLGERMFRAFEQQLAASPVLLIGTDCPGIDPAYLAAAAHALERGHDVVIGPAEDGGYVLVGARRIDRCVFSGIGWGGPEVMAATRTRLSACGLSWFELSYRWDVDRPADLARLAREFPALAHEHASGPVESRSGQGAGSHATQ